MPPPKPQSPRPALTAAERAALLRTLQTRFEQNPTRHPSLAWDKIEQRLAAAPAAKLWSLHELERTGGEPDVIGHDPATGTYLFVDCSPQSPIGRAGYCYDRAALDGRKANKPKNNVVDVADAMGVELLTEEQYRTLQQLGEFDTTTSSWVLTPPDVRQLGGALFCDRRYGRVFVFHNGADSYYSARGFRAALSV